ncbi:hypothetical protein ACIRU2_09975 [Streptomyces sp. NPDC101169]|uniref:hypothetical protein n=1 Tax=unclassified Streptomyces TaxID=2593676 RepID=UPI00380C0EDF
MRRGQLKPRPTANTTLVAVERQGDRWTVTADALTAPQHTVDTPVYEAIRTAVIHLIRSREIRPGMREPAFSWKP